MSRFISAKNNPFVVQRTDAIPFDFQETPFLNMEAFAQHVESNKFRGAILGRHGRGKTTLLCDLHSFFRQQGIESELVFLPRERSLQKGNLDNAIQRGESGAIVLVDGLERLPFWTRQRFIGHTKSFAGFIATTHHRGRLPTLLHCRTSQQTLASVLESLGVNQPEIVASSVPLFSKHRGNVRFVLRELYDQFAEGKIG
jgi:hypothetical protein